MRWQAGVDSYTHWIAGLFLIQGEDPYRAFLAEAEPATPIRHLDGRVSVASDFDLAAGRQPMQGGRISASPAANSPPMLILALPFSLVSWPTARKLHFTVNAVALLVIPVLAAALMERTAAPVSPFTRLLIVLLFLGGFATASSIIVAQPAIIATALMLASLLLLSHSHKTMAGIALGIALSKFTVTTPVWIYMLLKREWRVASVAVGVQLAGFLALAQLAETSTWQVAMSYLDVLIYLLPLRYEGEIAIMATLGGYPRVGLVAVALLSLLVGWAVATAVRSGRLRTGETADDPLLLSLLLVWGLVATRHLAYDMLVLIVPISYFMTHWNRAWQWPRAVRAGVVALMVLHLLPLTSIARRADVVSPGMGGDIVYAAWTAALIGVMIICAWLLARRPSLDHQVTGP